MSKLNKGFTLVEILATISIISIFSLTVVSNITGVIEQAQDSTQSFSIKTQKTDLEIKKAEAGSKEEIDKIEEIQLNLTLVEEVDRIIKNPTSTPKEKEEAAQKKNEYNKKIKEQKEELNNINKKGKRGGGSSGGGGGKSPVLINKPVIKFRLDFNISTDIENLNLKSNDFFGNSVAITPDGSTVVVGASGDGIGAERSGAVYIFTEKDSKGNFTSPKKIDSDTTGLDIDGTDFFGNSVSITPDGNTLVVGASLKDPGGGNSNKGAVYIFTEKDSNDEFINPKEISSEVTEGLIKKVKENGHFGSSVSITPDGSTVVVGASGDGIGGIVYIFTEKDSDGDFIRPKKISSNTTGLTLKNGDRFGNSVSITPDGNTLVVGAFTDDTGGERSGAVYVFTEKDSDGNFIKPKRIDSDTEGVTLDSFDFFGISVSITPDGNTLVVGARGVNEEKAATIYIFTEKDSEGNFIKPKKIGSDAEGLTLNEFDFFGVSVAITKDGNTLFVGSIGDDTAKETVGEVDRGAVYVFKKK